jgi:hypothetical protein
LKNVLTNDHIPNLADSHDFLDVMHFQISRIISKNNHWGSIGVCLSLFRKFDYLPMLIHVINNSIATIAHYFNPIEKFESSLPNEEIPFLPVLVITIFAMFIFRYIQSQSKFLQHANE